MGNKGKALERYAIAAYVQYGVRMHIPLSAGARRELQRIRKSYAGLTELAVARGMHKAPFESNQQFTARVLQERSHAHTVQVRSELA